MRAAVLVDGGQPGRAGVRRVRSWRRSRIELLDDCGPVHRRQPIRLTQIGDLHGASLHCPADILANSVPKIRHATTEKVIALWPWPGSSADTDNAPVHAPVSRLARSGSASREVVMNRFHTIRR